MANKNNGNISPDALEAMLKLASKKLGTTPEQLKSTLSDPQKADRLISELDKKQGGKIKSTLNNTKSMDQLMNNPNVKKMLNDLMGDKKNG